MVIDFFYSDPHFWHAKIIEATCRPFLMVEQMNECLIDEYNRRVGTTDHVLWLGDCCFRERELPGILDRMNGCKSLILGNHDKSTITFYLRAGFSAVLHEPRLWIADRVCLVSHYPYAGVGSRYPDRRPPKIKKHILIHGHTHEPVKRHGNMIHVGVDAWDYAPVPRACVEALVMEV